MKEIWNKSLFEKQENAFFPSTQSTTEINEQNTLDFSNILILFLSSVCNRDQIAPLKKQLLAFFSRLKLGEC